FRNEDQRSADYSDIKEKYRPGHADFTFDAKFGVRDYRGGGRSSARETVCRVAAGAIAKKLLAQQGVRVVGYVKQIGDIRAATSPPHGRGGGSRSRGRGAGAGSPVARRR